MSTIQIIILVTVILVITSLTILLSFKGSRYKIFGMLTKTKWDDKLLEYVIDRYKPQILTWLKLGKKYTIKQLNRALNSEKLYINKLIKKSTKQIMDKYLTTWATQKLSNEEVFKKLKEKILEEYKIMQDKF